MICMKKLTFCSHPRVIVKPQEPPSPAELTFETQIFFSKSNKQIHRKIACKTLTFLQSFQNRCAAKTTWIKEFDTPTPPPHLFLMDEDPGHMTGRTLFSKESRLGPGSVVGGKRQETGKTK